MSNQIRRAKALLESKGYTVSRKLKESYSEGIIDDMMTISEMIREFFGNIENFARDRDGDTSEIDVPCEMLGGTYDNVLMADEENNPDALRVFRELDSTDGKVVELPNSAGYCVLVDTEIGPMVYENLWGFEVIYMKRS